MSGAVEQADFEPFFAHRPGWTRLYIDLPGMGLTPADPHITDVESMLSALLKALPEWTQGRPFALSGTSAGAYLARGLVAAVPEQVMGLLLRVPRVVPDWQPRTLPPETTLIEDRTFQDTVRLLTPDERDADAHQVQMPLRTPPGFAVAQFLSEERRERDVPLSERLVANVETALLERFLTVTWRRGKR